MKRLLQKASAPEPDMIEIEETAEQPAGGKQRIPLTHRLGAKITAFILVIVLTALTLASAAGGIAMIGLELYTTPQAKYHEMVFAYLTEETAQVVAMHVLDGRFETAEDYCAYKNIEGVTIRVEGDPGARWQYGVTGGSSAGKCYESAWMMLGSGELLEDHGYYTESELKEMGATRFTATVYVSNELEQEDEFLLADRLVDAAYALRYWIFVIAVAALGCGIACFVFLMCASGRKKGFSEPCPGWGTWVPLDVLTFGAICIVFIILSIFDDAPYFYSDLKRIAAYFLCALMLFLVFVGWCMSFALRVKLGAWWKNTVVYRAVMLTVYILRMLYRLVKKLLTNLPLIWKTAAIYIAVAFADAVVAFCSWAEFDNLIIWLFVKNLVLFPLILFVALMLRKLQRGARALAEGDLEQGVDTAYLFGDFKRSAEDLSRIGEGMTAAVEQRIRSERMKTELITNVSHDLKTPLTSIINYADLIGKEPTDNETIAEYAAVLHRQSERLKRLVDDLVEASRASTGDVEIQLAPCELGVLLTQAAGEYGERLERSRLQLILRQPEEQVRIMTDGRRLWRVIDNLMGNICKYAQPDTRVYLTLEVCGSNACIAFKNTSREALDLSAEELMERFVRGDRSRNSEGNGLGLSIARSLTQLLGGEMELTVDGDLFKVVLRFPTIK